MRKPAYFLHRFFWESLDWLYPPHCGGCGAGGSRWCDACLAGTHLISEPFCSKCGQPQSTWIERSCRICSAAHPAYKALRSWAVFDGPLQNALHRLKYKKDVALGDALARPIVTWFMDLGWKIDLVAPVPLSRERLRSRGYNQAACLAHPFALNLELEYKPQAITRTRNTPSQVGLTSTERRENVADAFAGNQTLAGGKNVLIFDDVATTGATLDACAWALMQAGAAEVYAITAARAVKI